MGYWRRAIKITRLEKFRKTNILENTGVKQGDLTRFQAIELNGLKWRGYVYKISDKPLSNVFFILELNR